jgi:hypothetical protein
VELKQHLELERLVEVSESRTELDVLENVRLRLSASLWLTVQSDYLQQYSRQLLEPSSHLIHAP